MAVTYVSNRTVLYLLMIVTIAERGQVTTPPQVRRRMPGIKPGCSWIFMCHAGLALVSTLRGLLIARITRKPGLMGVHL